MVMWMDGNLKICILKVYHHEPVSLGKERDDSIKSDHPEAFGLDVYVDVSEIEDEMEASVSLWNCEVRGIETTV